MFTVKAYKEDHVEIFSAFQVRDRQHTSYAGVRSIDISDAEGYRHTIFVAKELPENLSLNSDSRYDIVYVVNEQNVTVHTIRTY